MGIRGRPVRPLPSPRLQTAIRLGRHNPPVWETLAEVNEPEFALLAAMIELARQDLTRPNRIRCDPADVEDARLFLEWVHEVFVGG